MKTYSILSNKSWQMIKKYCIEIDYNIRELQNYIDFTNPNKIILNYTYNKNETKFYTTEQLVDLGICSTNFTTLEWDHTNVPDENLDIIIDPDISVSFYLDDEWHIVANRGMTSNETYCWRVNQETDWMICPDTTPDGPQIKCGDTVTLCILDGQDEETYIKYGTTVVLRVNSIDTDELYAGQIIYNDFGQDVYVNGPDIILKQGFALFKVLSSNPDYLIMSLDSEGDYYVVSNVTSDGVVIFSRISHATATLGTNYLFSLAGPNARWFYYDYNRAGGAATSYKPSNWDGFTLTSWTWPEGVVSRIPLIMTPYRTLWTVSSTISNEILHKTVINDLNTYEEVIIEQETFTESKGLDKGSLSLYSMNTNMNNSLGNDMGLEVYLY